MAKYTLWHYYLVLSYEDESILLKSLTLPCSTLGPAGDKQIKKLAKLCQNKLKDQSPGDFFKQQLISEPRTESLEITLEPPNKSKTWLDPLKLMFRFVYWSDSPDKLIFVYIPDLKLYTILDAREDLKEQVEREIIHDLKRKRFRNSLYKLTLFQKVNEIEICKLRLTVQTDNLLDSLTEDKSSQNSLATLKEVAVDMGKQSIQEHFGLEDTISQLAYFLSSDSIQSVLLVGDSGCGKTSAVLELVRRKEEFGLAETGFWATSGSRLIAGMSGFGMWQERCENLIRELDAGKYILHMGNLLELLEVGKSTSQSESIASWMKPVIIRGQLVVIMEATPEQISLIEKKDPHLLTVFNRIDVTTAQKDKGLEILKKVAEGYFPDKPVSDGVIKLIDSLHRKYAPYSAYPARPLRFLKAVLQDLPVDEELSETIVHKSFSRETGIPLLLLDKKAPFVQKEILSWFKSRVMGQDHAVDEIYRLLTIIKAGMTRPSRPVASVLFMGPTGVGKTEMAKTLAHFLFGSADKLIRFDMSEFSSYYSVDRLIGSDYHQDGLLISRVREQPFSVLLLDEFEKAHPRFYDLLLQILDAGRLTDNKGRVADFCSTVIIMTSNLGVLSFEKGNLGFKDSENIPDKAKNHFKKELESFLKPEIYNRIDRVIPFSPIGQNILSDIVRREFELVKRLDGIAHRGVSLDISDEALSHIAKMGFDSRYGVRSLKRVLADELLVNLSQEINLYDSKTALNARIILRDNKVQIQVKARDISDNNDRYLSGNSKALKDMSLHISSLRRQTQKLMQSSTLIKVKNELAELENIQKKITDEKRKKKRSDTVLAKKLSRLPGLKSLYTEFTELKDRVSGLEDNVLLSIYRENKLNKNTKNLIDSLSDSFDMLLLKFYSIEQKNPNRITLAFHSKDLGLLEELVENYLIVADRLNLSQSYHSLFLLSAEELEQSDEEETLPYELISISHRENIFARKKRLLGIIIELSGEMVWPLLSTEKGLHVFKDNSKQRAVLVESTHLKAEKYRPDLEQIQQVKGDDNIVARIYREDNNEIHDKGVDKKYLWNKKLDILLEDILMDKRLNNARTILED